MLKDEGIYTVVEMYCEINLSYLLMAFYHLLKKSLNLVESADVALNRAIFNVNVPFSSQEKIKEFGLESVETSWFKKSHLVILKIL